MLQRQKGLREFAWLLAIGIGVALTSLVGRTASIVALTRGLRVWVNPKLRDLVDDDLRAIESLPVRPFFNHAVFVLATSLAFPVLVLRSWNPGTRVRFTSVFRAFLGVARGRLLNPLRHFRRSVDLTGRLSFLPPFF